MRTEYALQEIGPDGNEHERYWIRPLYDHGEPVTDYAEAYTRAGMAATTHYGRRFRILERTVSDWGEVK